MEQNQKGLDRYLSPLDAWAMAFGCTVGWGAYVMPGTTFLPIAGPAGTIISMIIGMAVMALVSSSISYLMFRNPWTGGLYSYTKEAFGRDHAFLCSWFLCLSYLTIVFLNGTALFLVIRMMFGESLQTGVHYTVAGNVIDLGEVAVSVGALAGIGILFVVAKSVLQRLHTVLSVVLLAGSVLVTLICAPHALDAEILTSFGSERVNGAFSVFSLVILAPWAFVGFEIISFETPHFKFPLAKARGIVVLSILLAGFVYIAMTIVSVSAIPDGYSSWQAYITAANAMGGIEEVPTFHAARTYMGTPGLVVLGLTALAAIMTGIIGAYRAIVRVMSTMAEDRILSERFQKTSYSILFIMVLSILVSLLGRNTLNWIVDLTSFGASVAYGYTSAAAYKIARTEGDRRMMVIGLAGAGIAVVFIVVQMIPNMAAIDAMGSESFLLLALWCLLGFAFYWRTVNRTNLTEYSGMSASGVVLFALLLYASFMWIGKMTAAQPDMDAARHSMRWGGIVLLAIVFTGFVVMLLIQRLVREKHEAIEREKIRAVEGSLAKSQFLFNMSHDIRTPMNAIIGYTNLALKEPAPPQLHEYLNKIELSSRHLLALLDDILEMSRIENGQVKLEYLPMDFIRIFEEIRDLFEEQMQQKSLDFTIHTGQVQHRYVWCDRKNMNRVLLNVISNAYKFTPAGGTISASVWETGSGESGYAAYEIRIKDSGIGMSKDFVEKMFNAFERERTSTDSGVEGTGLGLSITKRIVDLMGGNIEVLTSPGSGTEMVIRLKMRIAEASEVGADAQPKTEAEEEHIDFTKKRLLLVEDNAINLEIAKMILSQYGFMLETAENGQIALDMVAGSQPGYYDAVLMDIQMPVMDGYTATRMIRQLENPELARIPILAMTANAFKEDEEAAFESGMQAHIAKPIDVDVLIETLKKFLKKP